MKISEGKKKNSPESSVNRQLTTSFRPGYSEPELELGTIFKIIKIIFFKELKPEIDDTCGWLVHSYPLWLGKRHK